MKRTLATCTTFFLLAAALCQAQPSPYKVSYEARYSGMKATAERMLSRSGEQYLFESTVTLKLFGQTLTRINEQSRFRFERGTILSREYAFEQTGLGSRSRSALFDPAADEVLTTVNGDEQTLSMTAPVFDELNQLLGIRQQLEQGNEFISLQAVDENRIEEASFRLIAREEVSTPLGRFDTLKLEKIRAPDSERTTQFWFAPALDYVMVKLYQRNPDGRELTMEISETDIPRADAESGGFQP